MSEKTSFQEINESALHEGQTESPKEGDVTELIIKSYDIVRPHFYDIVPLRMSEYEGVSYLSIATEQPRTLTGEFVYHSAASAAEDLLKLYEGGYLPIPDRGRLSESVILPITERADEKDVASHILPGPSSERILGYGIFLPKPSPSGPWDEAVIARWTRGGSHD